MFANFEDQRLYRQDPVWHHGRSPAARAGCPPVRRPARVARRARRRVRPRAPRGRRGATDERAGDARVRRLGRAACGRLGPRLLRVATVLSRRRPAGLARVGPAPHALGRHRADGRRRRERPRRKGAACGGGPAESVFQPEWSPEGIAASRLGPDRVVERVPRGSRRDATEPGAARGRVRRAAVGVRVRDVRVPLRRAHRLRVPTRRRAPPGDARPGHVRAPRSGSPVRVFRPAVRARRRHPDRLRRLVAHRATAGGDARLRHAGGRRAPRRRGGRCRCGVPFGAGGDLVPDGRRCGVRVPLPADEP